MVSSIWWLIMSIFFVFIALFLIMGIAGLIYLYKKIYGAADFFFPKLKKKYRILLSVGILAAAVLPAFFSMVVWFIVIMHFIVFLALCDVAVFIVRKADKDHRFRFPRWGNILYRSGAAALAMTLLFFCYAKYNMYHVVRTEYDVTVHKQLAKPFTVVMIADLHYGLSLDADQLQAVVDSIGKEKPDAVILCGDIVDERTTLEGLNEAFSILGGLESRFGVYYVYGNHDRSKYAEFANFSDFQLIDAIESNRIEILNDHAVTFNDDVVLVGRADKLDSGGNRKSISELLGETDRAKTIIVADHEPSDYDSLEKNGCDLVLSGHTHGGQIFPLAIINNLIGFSELNYGYKKQGNLNAVVTSGIAGWGFDIRTQHHSEYVVIRMTGR